MKKTSLSAITTSSLAIAALIVSAPASASAGNAHAASAAIKDYPITLLSESSDGGVYIWDAQLDKDPTDPTYSDITVLSGAARFKWTWPGEGTQASHNVKMKVGVNYLTNKPFSTPGLDFFKGKGSGSPITNNSGADITWPTLSNGGVNGWVPTKAGTYYLFCSQHTSMYMRVIVKPLVGSASTKRSLRKGTRGVSASFTSAAASRSSLKLVLCKNGKCSKTKTIASKSFNVRAGRNTLKLPTKGLAKGSYRLLVTTNGNVVVAKFAVKG
jgi:hypothetical protein